MLSIPLSELNEFILEQTAEWFYFRRSTFWNVWPLCVTAEGVTIKHPVKILSLISSKRELKRNGWRQDSFLTARRLRWCFLRVSLPKFTVIRPTHLRSSLVSGLMRTGLSHRFPIWEMCGLLCRCCGLVGGLGLGGGGGDGAGEGGRVKQPLRQ